MRYVLRLFPELEKRWTIGARFLSGGEQQMVVLGQALVARPKTLVIDETLVGSRSDRCQAIGSDSSRRPSPNRQALNFT